jgi:hypothetical protein
MTVANDNLLGTYLKDRRAKLDPATFGFPLTRRRTPGLRREEVAQRDNDVRTHGEGVKHLRHPITGSIQFEYSAFAVDGRPDLSLVIYNPATPADADRIRSLVKPQTSAST